MPDKALHQYQAVDLIRLPYDAAGRLRIFEIACLTKKRGFVKHLRCQALARFVEARPAPAKSTAAQPSAKPHKPAHNPDMLLMRNLLTDKPFYLSIDHIHHIVDITNEKYPIHYKLL